MFILGIAIFGDYYSLIVLSMLSRGLSGVAFTCIYISSFALIAVAYPDRRNRYITYTETFAGVGLIGGPSIGIALNSILGFSGVLFSIGGIMIVFLPLCVYVNNYKFDETEKNNKIGYFALFKQKGVSASFLVSTYVNMCFGYIDPSLGPYIVGEGFPEMQVSVCFILMSMLYFTTCLLMSGIVDNNSPFLFMLFGVSLCTAALFLFGSNEYLFPQTLATLYIGVSLLGMGGAFIFTMVLPSMIEQTKQFPGSTEEKINVLSGLFSMSVALGEIVGPLVAGMVGGTFGYQISSSFMLLSGILASLWYLHFYLSKTDTSDNRLSVGLLVKDGF